MAIARRLATGLQIAIPTGRDFDYNVARKVNEFFAQYFTQNIRIFLLLSAK